jgi:hypothetical protein
VHSGHLDFVRGRRATVAMRLSELLGGLTLSLGYPTADLTATIPFTTSAGLEHHTMRRQRNKVFTIKSARNSKGSAYEYDT